MTTSTETHVAHLLTHGIAAEYLPLGDWSTKSVAAARGRLYRAGKAAGIRVIVSSTGSGIGLITAVVPKHGPRLVEAR